MKKTIFFNPFRHHLPAREEGAMYLYSTIFRIHFLTSSQRPTKPEAHLQHP